MDHKRHPPTSIGSMTLAKHMMTLSWIQTSDVKCCCNLTSDLPENATREHVTWDECSEASYQCYEILRYTSRFLSRQKYSLNLLFLQVKVNAASSKTYFSLVLSRSNVWRASHRNLCVLTFDLVFGYRAREMFGKCLYIQDCVLILFLPSTSISHTLQSILSFK